MHTSVSLTVAESKRLIAKGIARDNRVRQAFKKGTIAVTTGTTNGYVIEELTGEPFPKSTYVTGRTLPASFDGEKPGYTASDFVVRKGERVSMKAVEAAAEMGPGDVFLKGANAINYDLRQAGVLIGHPTGGTVGASLGCIVAQRIHLLHPVGLEKNIPGDLAEAAARHKEADGKGPALWLTPGELFTEIEALLQLSGVEALPVGAGGIGGAEGAVWLTLFGTRSQLDKALSVIEDVYGEPPFLSPA